MSTTNLLATVTSMFVGAPVQGGSFWGRIAKLGVSLSVAACMIPQLVHGFLKCIPWTIHNAVCKDKGILSDGVVCEATSVTEECKGFSTLFDGYAEILLATFLLADVIVACTMFIHTSRLESLAFFLAYWFLLAVVDESFDNLQHVFLTLVLVVVFAILRAVFNTCSTAITFAIDFGAALGRLVFRTSDFFTSQQIVQGAMGVSLILVAVLPWKNIVAMD